MYEGIDQIGISNRAITVQIYIQGLTLYTTINVLKTKKIRKGNKIYLHWKWSRATLGGGGVILL